MTKRLKKIAPLQLGKMLGLVYGLGSLLIIPIFVLFAVVASLASRAQGQNGPPAAALIGMSIGFMIFAPVLYAVMGFLTGAVGALIYNVVASWIGGIEVEVE